MAQGVSAAPNSFFADRRALVVALLLGAIAAGLIVAYLANRDSGGGTATPVPSVAVVVALMDIASGTTITEEMVGLQSVPRDLALAGAATKIDSVIGEVARYPLVEGEQIGEFRLVGKASARTLSAQIPKGLRGFTVPVSVNNSPAGVLAPGDFVDIIVSGPLSLVQLPSESGVNDDDSDLRAAVTLLQNVQVLAVQREYVNNGVPYDSSVRGEAPEADRIGYVTLAVTPEQAQLLWLASQHTTITLTLRPFGDEEVVDLFPIAEPFRLE